MPATVTQLADYQVRRAERARTLEQQALLFESYERAAAMLDRSPASIRRARFAADTRAAVARLTR